MSFAKPDVMLVSKSVKCHPKSQLVFDVQIMQKFETWSKTHSNTDERTRSEKGTQFDVFARPAWQNISTKKESNKSSKTIKTQKIWTIKKSILAKDPPQSFVSRESSKFVGHFYARFPSMWLLWVPPGAATATVWRRPGCINTRDL